MATLAFTCSVLCLAIIGGGVFVLRLTNGPIAIDLGPQIAAALSGRVGGGYAFTIGTTSVERGEHGPA